MTITPQFIAVLGAVFGEILAMFGSCVACLKTGEAGSATLAEDSSQFRNVITLAALPLTQTFYMMIVMVTVFALVLPKLPETGSVGWWVFGITMMTGLAELHSAYFQGRVCVSAIALLPKSKGFLFTPGILMAAYIELEGILGMVFAIMAFALLRLM